ncbi:hypothetical protein IEO21_07268 [Rhodonia placenta]|uniref:Uncharacterized protein n=1 Tax=Rhodonia placenta TaxID=104341 RepID=A0A8H7NYH0_9APHY|nr:hypothetical protein IEO21_07268 [Postia placenta]
MLSPLVAHTIHEIVTTVENDVLYGSSLFLNSDGKFRRAQRLTSEALNILRLLRDQMDDVQRAEYGTLYGRTQDVMGVTPSQRLDAAKDLWDFAHVSTLDPTLALIGCITHGVLIQSVFQTVNDRAINPPGAPRQIPISLPVEPRPAQYTLPPLPTMQNVQFLPIIQYPASWTPVTSLTLTASPGVVFLTTPGYAVHAP